MSYIPGLALRCCRTSAQYSYCDIAVSRLEDYSGEKFAFKVWDKATLPERNLAVGRARIWLEHAAHGAK
jgi:hypothetical protein